MKNAAHVATSLRFIAGRLATASESLRVAAQACQAPEDPKEPTQTARAHAETAYASSSEALAIVENTASLLGPLVNLVSRAMKEPA